MAPAWRRPLASAGGCEREREREREREWFGERDLREIRNEIFRATGIYREEGTSLLRSHVWLRSICKKAPQKLRLMQHTSPLHLPLGQG